MVMLDHRRRRNQLPTVTDVLKVIEEGPDIRREAARSYSEAGYQDRSADLVFTLDLLATGSLAGVFDKPQWWRHAEAITRLTALWQSWEAMRLQPGTGTANWLRDHLDHQLPILLGRSGPFAQCSEDEHIAPRIAAAESAPAGWWDTQDDEAQSLPLAAATEEKDQPS